MRSTKIVNQDQFPGFRVGRIGVIRPGNRLFQLNFSPQNAGVIVSLARLLSFSYSSERCGTLHLCNINQNQNNGLYAQLVQLAQLVHARAPNNLHFEIFFACNNVSYLDWIQGFVRANNYVPPNLNQLSNWMTFARSRNRIVIRILWMIKNSLDAGNPQDGNDRDNELISEFIDIIRDVLKLEDRNAILMNANSNRNPRNRADRVLAQSITICILQMYVDGVGQPRPIRNFRSFWSMRQQIHQYLGNDVRLNHADCFRKVVCKISVCLNDLDNFLRITSRVQPNFHTGQNRRINRNPLLNPRQVEQALQQSEQENYDQIAQIFRRTQWPQNPNHHHWAINGGQFGHNNAGHNRFGQNLINGILWIKNNSNLDNNGLDQLTSSHFHCECRMIEHIIALGGGNLSVGWRIFITSVREMKTGISKPCCFYCYIFLTTCALIFDNNHRNNYLGLRNLVRDQIDRWLRPTEQRLERLLRQQKIQITRDEYQRVNSDCRLINERFGCSGILYYQYSRLGDWISPSCLTTPNLPNGFQDIMLFREVFAFLVSLFRERRGNEYVYINQVTESFNQQL